MVVMRMANINLKWFNNRRGFSWVISVTGAGIIKASLRIINTRKGLRIVRSIYLIPKRASEFEAQEIFSEYYDVYSFMEILNNTLTLITPLSSEIDPLRQVLIDISKIVESLENVKKIIEEVVENVKS